MLFCRSLVASLLVLALGCAAAPTRDSGRAPNPSLAPNGAPTPDAATVVPAPAPDTAAGLRFATPPPDAAPPATAGSAVTLTISVSRSTIRARQPVTFTVTLSNHGTASIWTSPSVICTGSWDYFVRNANGERIRTDDRDMMGCPSGGLLRKEIPPGDSISLPLGWDGTVRDRNPRGVRDAPRGDYEIEATARWGDRANTPNGPGPHAVTESARTTITVVSNVPPPPAPPAPQPKPPPPPSPAPKLDPRDNLRQRLATFTPPVRVVVTTAAGDVTVEMRDVRSARAAIAAVSATTRSADDRRAQIERIIAKFQQRHHGASLHDVDKALFKLRRAHRDAVVSDIARRHGIRQPRLISWGPAGSGVGIAGKINGKPVILAGSKIYRGKNRPPHFFDK